MDIKDFSHHINYINKIYKSQMFEKVTVINLMQDSIHMLTPERVQLPFYWLIIMAKTGTSGFLKLKNQITTKCIDKMTQERNCW